MHQGTFVKGAAFSVVAVLLGGSVAFSSLAPASGSQVRAAKKKVYCENSTTCIFAENTGDGVAIEGVGSGNAGGLIGTASGSGLNGVFGQSLNGNGGYFTSFSASDAGVHAESTTSTGYPLEAYDTYTGDQFYVDAFGDGVFSGSVTATTYYEGVRTRGGERVTASLAMAAAPAIEDTGTARLVNGEGVVRFDPAFAGAIDPSRGYQLFLTPKGDTRGLYVAAEYEGGFIVRENEHGRSSVYFDYRVVAHPYGASDARLPRLHLQPLPPSHRPRLTVLQR